MKKALLISLMVCGTGLLGMRYGATDLGNSSNNSTTTNNDTDQWPTTTNWDNDQTSNSDPKSDVDRTTDMTNINNISAEESRIAHSTDDQDDN